MTPQELSRHHVDDLLISHFREREQRSPARAKRLLEAMRYSLFNGGKRFRPYVSALTADALGCSRDRIWPLAAAIELVHTYSLIHDDLPCMDDDQWRRGQPTNHMVHGEALALLAGDALLTEAFFIIGQYYASVPEVGLTLTKLLGNAAGMTGMVAGQTMDIFASHDLTPEELIQMHELKTGALIGAAVMGVAEIARVQPTQKTTLREFGRELGLAFQLADDILDYQSGELEPSGFPKFFGLEGTRKHLLQVSQSASNRLAVFGSSGEGLRKLIEYNLQRDH